MSELDDLRGRVKRIACLLEFHEALKLSRLTNKKEADEVKHRMTSSEDEIVKLCMESKSIIKNMQSKQKI